VIAIAALLLSSAFAADTDISGKWSGFPIYLTLKQDGNAVSGSAGESEDDQVPFQSGSIDGDKLTLNFGAIAIALTVQGDQMTGEAHQGTNTMKLVFKRLKPRDPSAPPPAFDVATVKRAAPQPANRTGFSNMKADPGRLTCTNVPLKKFVVAAWGLKEYQVSAPDWMNDERYDLTATMAAGIPPQDVLLMLQTLLTERFHIAVHRETRELAVYALTVDKGGVRLKAAEGFGGTSVSISPKGRSLRANVTMKNFASSLSGLVDKPVVDMTGLTGGFNINLEWMPDELSAKTSDTAAESAPGPSIFTALHDVGLKLESRKAPVEILVVDKAEKVPAEN
jgi:uncharacterized protein (TIGR03435 family)